MKACLSCLYILHYSNITLFNLFIKMYMYMYKAIKHSHGLDVNEDCMSESSEDSSSSTGSRCAGADNDDNDAMTSSQRNDFLRSPEWLTLLSMLSEKGYVLDIDLDFFSTMDPFRKQFTVEQYSLLKTIYAFKPPLDDSDQVLHHSLLAYVDFLLIV